MRGAKKKEDPAGAARRELIDGVSLREPIAAAAAALAWGLLVSEAGYAVMRSFQAIFGVQADPSRVSWSVHAGFFWRAITVSFAGGIAAFVAWTASRARAAASARWLPVAIAVASTLLLLQTIFLP